MKLNTAVRYSGFFHHLKNLPNVVCLALTTSGLAKCFSMNIYKYGFIVTDWLCNLLPASIKWQPCVTKLLTYLLSASTFTIWGSTSALKSFSCSICLFTASMSEPRAPIPANFSSALSRNSNRFCKARPTLVTSNHLLHGTVCRHYSDE